MEFINFSYNDNKDFTEQGRELLYKIKNNKKLTPQQCIEIIEDFSKNQPGEEYGGGEPCFNTDCYRYFPFDYFIKIKNKIYKKNKMKECEILVCPDCLKGMECV
jgi:hypothetical protein